MCQYCMAVQTSKSSLWHAGDNLNLNGDFLTNGIQHIRTFDPEAQEYSIVNVMDRGRWYPSTTVMADGNILIVGGMQQASNCHVTLTTVHGYCCSSTCRRSLPEQTLTYVWWANCGQIMGRVWQACRLSTGSSSLTWLPWLYTVLVALAVMSSSWLHNIFLPF